MLFVSIILFSQALAQSTNPNANAEYQAALNAGNKYRCNNVLMTFNSKATCDRLTQFYNTLKTCSGDRSSPEQKKLTKADVQEAISNAPDGSLWKGENADALWDKFFNTDDSNNKEWSTLQEFMQKVESQQGGLEDAGVVALFPLQEHLEKSCYTWCGDQKVRFWTKDMCTTAQTAYSNLAECDGIVSKESLKKFFIDNNNTLKHTGPVNTPNYAPEAYADFLQKKMSVDSDANTIQEWEFIKPFSGWTDGKAAGGVTGGNWNFNMLEMIEQVSTAKDCSEGAETATEAASEATEAATATEAASEATEAAAAASGVAKTITPAALIATMALLM